MMTWEAFRSMLNFGCSPIFTHELVSICLTERLLKCKQRLWRVVCTQRMLGITIQSKLISLGASWAKDKYFRLRGLEKKLVHESYSLEERPLDWVWLCFWSVTRETTDSVSDIKETKMNTKGWNPTREVTLLFLFCCCWLMFKSTEFFSFVSSLEKKMPQGCLTF